MDAIANMPTYEAYKDSDEEWIGSIPREWDLVPLRSVFRFRNEKNDPIKTDNVLSLSIANGVTQYSEEGRGGNKRKDDLTAYKIAHPNDIVLNSMNVIVGAVGLSKYYGAISPVYYALYSDNSDVDVKYYENIFQNEGFQRGLLKFGKGILIKLSGTGKLNTIRMKVSVDDLKTLYFPKPPIEDQRLIANFLDQKTAQIDEAIAIKEQQIALLKERKQIIIQKAVTQGLDPDVPMKDSGVDWIGEIPAHWDLMALRYAFSFLNSQRIPLSAPERENKQGIYPYYGASGIIDYVDEYIFDEDLILIAEDGANLLSKSTPLAFVANGKYWVNNHAHIIKPKHKGFKYWAELLSGLDYTIFISGAAQPKLTRDRLASVRVPVPPLSEIEAIIDYIESIEPHINKAMRLQFEQISKLKEYKTTLINSAVTGKIRITPEMVA